MPENIDIKCDDLSPIAHGQAVAEARQPYDGEGKILSVTATCSVMPSEVFAGEARYLGKVRFDCLVKLDDKTECVSTVAEFSDKITSDKIAAGMTPALVAELINTEASLDGGYIKFVAVVDTVVFAPVERCYTNPAGQSDGIFTAKELIECTSSAITAQETVYLTDAISDVKAENVLFAFSRAAVTGAECGDGEIKLTGAVYSNVVVGTDDGLCASYALTTPFVKTLSALGVTEGQIAVGNAAVVDTSATLEVDGDEKTLELAVTLTLYATAAETCEKEITVDAFSCSNELDLTYDDAAFFTALPLTAVVDTIDGQLALDKDRMAADTVLCVANTFCAISDAKTEGGKLNVEGLVGGDIVYYNAERKAADSIAFRLPFSMPLDIKTDADDAFVTAEVIGVNVKIRRESVFDIKADAAFTARLQKRRQMRIVTGLTVGEPKPKTDATVMVHIAKEGETLWQAAKALGCSPEMLGEQNAAESPFKAGERLMCFYNVEP